MISETYLLTSNHLRTPLYFYCLMIGISFLWNFRSEDRQMHLLNIYINFLWRNMLWLTIMDLSQLEWDSRSKVLNNKKLKWLYYYWIYHERCKRRRQINILKHKFKHQLDKWDCGQKKLVLKINKNVIYIESLPFSRLTLV